MAKCTRLIHACVCVFFIYFSSFFLSSKFCLIIHSATAVPPEGRSYRWAEGLHYLTLNQAGGGGMFSVCLRASIRRTYELAGLGLATGFVGTHDPCGENPRDALI